jgi:hypothetical protein
VGEGDQVREDQTGMRRGFANGFITSASRAERTCAAVWACCKRRFRLDTDVGSIRIAQGPAEAACEMLRGLVD